MDNEKQPRRVLAPLTTLIMLTLIAGVMVALVIGVTWLVNNSKYWSAPEVSGSTSEEGIALFAEGEVVTITPTLPVFTPTPDPPHALPPIRAKTEQYSVRSGDSLGVIAQRYGISLEQLIDANELANPNALEVGQILIVPVPSPDTAGPYFKIIPDSELVYGPSSHFDIKSFIERQGGYLASYTKEVNEDVLTGAQIVERIAKNHSVNPRLLLAVLEYQSGWVTLPNPDPDTFKQPIADLGEKAEGLYLQLNWAANNLNMGYYLWRVNGTATWLLGDGSVVPIDPTINAGTAGVQHMFAPLYDSDGWNQAVTESGLYATYAALFGFPFNYAIEPLMAPDLQQPKMQLPFEEDVVWSFTGGGHGGWGSGSGWAALDFAPPGEALGCVQSDEWVVAVADGLILRADNGAVIQDLDGDGLEGTGWVVLYMHIETRDRVEPGTQLKTGERVGHPSCEGGISSGTHVHLARRYNGEWIPVDQDIPFTLDSWISSGTGQIYDGFLTRDGQVVEAYAGRSEENAIQR